MLLTASAVEAHSLSAARADSAIAPRQPRKIDQLMPIVAEIEQIPSRRNSRLKSRAQISADRGDGSSSDAEKFALRNQRATIA
jgi:hypothetical protein